MSSWLCWSHLHIPHIFLAPKVAGENLKWIAVPSASPAIRRMHLPCEARLHHLRCANVKKSLFGGCRRKYGTALGSFLCSGHGHEMTTYIGDNIQLCIFNIIYIYTHNTYVFRCDLTYHPACPDNDRCLTTRWQLLGQLHESAGQRASIARSCPDWLRDASRESGETVGGGDDSGIQAPSQAAPTIYTLHTCTYCVYYIYTHCIQYIYIYTLYIYIVYIYMYIYINSVCVYIIYIYIYILIDLIWFDWGGHLSRGSLNSHGRTSDGKNHFEATKWKATNGTHSNSHWIGLREKLQETMVFTIKYRAFL